LEESLPNVFLCERGTIATHFEQIVVRALWREILYHAKGLEPSQYGRAAFDPVGVYADVRGDQALQAIPFPFIGGFANGAMTVGYTGLLRSQAVPLRGTTLAERAVADAAM
jgi:hypothetical protein